MRHVNSEENKMTGLRRIGQTWYIRVQIPKDRQADAGRAFGTRSGIKEDHQKTLETRDRLEAIKRRPMALLSVTHEINTKLKAAGFVPLDEDWTPQWANDATLVTEALSARKEILSASTTQDQSERIQTVTPSGAAHSIVLHTSPRDRAKDAMLDVASDRASALNERGENGSAYYRKFTAIAEGSATPIGVLMDRWSKERALDVGPAMLAIDRASFNHFAGFITSALAQTNYNSEQAMLYLRSQPIEELSPSLLGQFAPWLAQEHSLTAKTVAARISPLKVFWDWTIRTHAITGPNPWIGATTGLKKRDKRASKGRPALDCYTDAELVKLLTVDTDGQHKWAWGQALSDLMRLALFTGARQNELCSLTVSRVLIYDNTEELLWGIQVTEEEAKTDAGIRKIPIHPLIKPIIARRLHKAKALPGDDNPLFPECKPGPLQNGSKRSHYFSQAFTKFRRDVLGAGSDNRRNFHSFRRNFITAMEVALGKGATACTPLVRHHLAGHEASGDIGAQVYISDNLGWPIYSAAILGMVETGYSDTVKAVI
ncbi:site-specific integrase [Acetobacter orientalis]|nr:tyrosine-type recombinase/integrase [Acetobacter orientalis]